MVNKIRDITRNDEGQFEVVDAAGKVIEGPFETNAKAWQALEQLDRESVTSAGAKGGKKKRANKSKRSGKMTAKQEKRMRLAAGKAAGWVRSVAATKFDPAETRAYKNRRLGSCGAASEVKRIDPETYLAEKAARGEKGGAV